MQRNNESSNRNLIFAIAISLAIILLWGYVFPSEKKSSKSLSIGSETIQENDVVQENKVSNGVVTNSETFKERKITLKNDNIFVKVDTKGLKIEEIILLNNDVHSPLIDSQVFVQNGFISQTHSVPHKNTIWEVVNTTDTSVTLRTVMNGVQFMQNITIDDELFIKTKLQIVNDSTLPVLFKNFARINQVLDEMPPRNAISHEGPIAYTDSTLHEKSYYKLKKKGDFTFHSTDGKNLWFGFSDKYTLMSFIASGKQDIRFIHPKKDDKKVFQVSSLSETHTVMAGESLSLDYTIFVGEKRLKVLESVTKEYDIPHFDKAIDFGFLYFITKPMFLMLNFIYHSVGSFAVAIVLLTFLMKIVLLPLTVKSSMSMAKMKKLQPEIKRLQETYKDDKRSLGQATVKLYQEKKVNPLAGCLPMLIQVPIFFALYKVLYVSTEMKNAPLFFWITDLSSPDPTSILNIFGLLPYSTPHFLGVLPILFGISMFLYQKSSPQPSDKTQAQIMKFLPIIMTVFLSSFAAGLLFYWIVSNIFSVIQQLAIEKIIIPRYDKKHFHRK
ncbi:MAG: YidC/Oxa1 family membrane protein insertase [Candidatus Deianiraeaceae bacterium]|jgi:YidC/Oxa1 family membrane protein insertase